MDSKRFLDSVGKFGSTMEEICRNTLGIDSEKVNEMVIISPGWLPERLFATGEITEVVQASPMFGYRIWDVKQCGRSLTYIKTGFGAPVVMDCVLLLGLTGKCKRIFFVSSVGGLTAEMNIGDIVLPEYSVCGDGASRYLAGDYRNDNLGEKQYPHGALFHRVMHVTRDICERRGVRWHLGKMFCIDTIVAQQPHLERIMNEGYNAIDMESGVAFKVAEMFKIPIVAILNVSDNSVKENKSLLSERSEEERNYRKFVAREIIPQIIMEAMGECV